MLKNLLTMLSSGDAQLKIIGFIFGFLSYLIFASPLTLADKAALFMIHLVLTCLFTWATSIAEGKNSPPS